MGETSLAKMGTLALLLGVSTLVALRYAAKYGWLAGNTHWLTHRRSFRNIPGERMCDEPTTG
jgi:hypothetical protein